MGPAAGWRGDGSGADGPPAAGAAAWRSWAIPEKGAASVEAVSGGASITRPPCAARCTVSPAKSRCTSAAEGSGPGRGAARAGGAPGAPPRGQGGIAPACGGGALRRESVRLGNGTRTLREREGGADQPLDPGEEAARALEGHLIGRPIEEPRQQGLLGAP